MSINKKTGQGRSLTEENRALQLFTDRHEFTRLLAEYLNDDPPCEQILCFHGDGGDGKSLLLRFLQGVNEWIGGFDRALLLSRYELCRSLLEIRSELLIQSDFHLGSISQSEGNYFAQLARHAEAKQKYLEGVAAYNSALTLAPD